MTLVVSATRSESATTSLEPQLGLLSASWRVSVRNRVVEPWMPCRLDTAAHSLAQCLPAGSKSSGVGPESQAKLHKAQPAAIQAAKLQCKPDSKRTVIQPAGWSVHHEGSAALGALKVRDSCAQVCTGIPGALHGEGHALAALGSCPRSCPLLQHGLLCLVTGLHHALEVQLCVETVRTVCSCWCRPKATKHLTSTNGSPTFTGCLHCDPGQR